MISNSTVSLKAYKYEKKKFKYIEYNWDYSIEANFSTFYFLFEKHPTKPKTFLKRGSYEYYQDMILAIEKQQYKNTKGIKWVAKNSFKQTQIM